MKSELIIDEDGIPFVRPCPYCKATHDLREECPGILSDAPKGEMSMAVFRALRIGDYVRLKTGERCQVVRRFPAHDIIGIHGPSGYMQMTRDAFVVVDGDVFAVDGMEDAIPPKMLQRCPRCQKFAAITNRSKFLTPPMVEAGICETCSAEVETMFAALASPCSSEDILRASGRVQQADGMWAWPAQIKENKEHGELYKFTCCGYSFRAKMPPIRCPGCTKHP
jgi:hypothetical protein